VARVAGHRRRPAARTGPPVGLRRSCRSGPGPAPRRGAGSRRRARGRPDLLVVGRIGKPQGIKGEVTVRSAPTTRTAASPPGQVPATEPGRARAADVAPPAGRTAGWSSRSRAWRPQRRRAAAETLLQVDCAHAAAAEDEDEFHDHVLRGMAAVLVGGAPLGEVVDVLHLPHGDVLVVRGTTASGPAPSCWCRSSRRWCRSSTWRPPARGRPAGGPAGPDGRAGPRRGRRRGLTCSSTSSRSSPSTSPRWRSR
jgi:16S rRNA processing protein RimM